MTAAQSLNLYNISLRYFKNEADAASFVKEIEIIIDGKVEEGNKNYEALLHKDLEIMRSEMATKKDLYQISEKLSGRISDQMKWMIGLFIPLYLSIIGLFVTILLKH